MYCAGGRRAPNVAVKSVSEGPGMGGLDSNVAPGRGRMMNSGMLLRVEVCLEVKTGCWVDVYNLYKLRLDASHD